MSKTSSRCSHVTQAVGHLTRSDLTQLLTNPSCDVCRRSAASTNLWLCLYPDCYMLGCTVAPNDHSTQHNKATPDHCIQMNISNMRAWCYHCKSEVVLSNNQPPVTGVLGQQVDSPEEDDEMSGTIGLSNLGNTCYMNSVLQCLSSTPALTKFFLNCPDLVPRNVKPALGQAYGKLIVELWQSRGGPGYVAPTGVLHAIKQAWPSFRGFQQHDAQEFLRCCMDQLHKELSIPVQERDEDIKDVERVEIVSEHESYNGSSEEYDTAESVVSEDVPNDRKRKLTNNDQDRDSGLGSLSGVNKMSKIPSAGSASSLSDQEFCDATSEEDLDTKKLDPRQMFSDIRRHKVRNYRSIVTDVFDGSLVSSVKCLTCDTVSKTCETFQDLSLPIPSSDMATNTRSGPQQGWVGWAWEWLTSWFYGPDVSLFDCLECFFSEDELKGDNMYSCENCKKLRNGLKFSQVTELPDTLCIHLKRFRHDFSFSSKISTRVNFPLTGLDMGPWVHPECRAGRETSYSLTGVVCHHGTAGGGHYTSFCLHPVTGQWLHFDDSLVRQVDSQTVLNSEAYVLFYRKDSPVMETRREEVGRLVEQNCQTDSLLNHYIANNWLTKFYTIAEPGPIDNSSVLCKHGRVQPHRAETAANLCTAVTPAVWSYLHDRFGGSAAVTRLQVCTPCLAAARAEQKQKEFELSEFKLLHAEEGGEKDHAVDRYCLSASWFKSWEAWVCGRSREPPGPINNRSLTVQRPHGHSLRPNMDHFKFGEDIWSMLLSLYGGGPEVVLPADGVGVRVSTPKTETLTRLRQRWHLRYQASQQETEDTEQLE